MTCFERFDILQRGSQYVVISLNDMFLLTHFRCSHLVKNTSVSHMAAEYKRKYKQVLLMQKKKSYTFGRIVNCVIFSVSVIKKVSWKWLMLAGTCRHISYHLIIWYCIYYCKTCGNSSLDFFIFNSSRMKLDVKRYFLITISASKFLWRRKRRTATLKKRNLPHLH
jgi:hypothetical protein